MSAQNCFCAYCRHNVGTIIVNKMAIISIKRRSEERRDGYAALYAVFNINREKVRVPIGLTVRADDWDQEAEKVKGRGKEVNDKNLIIENVRARVNDVLVRARLTNVILTRALFWAMYRQPVSQYKAGEFISFCWEYMNVNKKANAFNTWKQHKSIITKLESWRPQLQFYEVTPELLRLYVAHLRHIGNGEATIWKNITVIRVYVLAAIRAGYIQKNPFDTFKIKHPKPQIVYLTEEELKELVAMYKRDDLEKHDQDVLRFFLFMCFTSLHISDARALTIEAIFGGELHYSRKKTHAQVSVPLSAPALQLIKYYQGERKKGVLITGLPTDQNINRTLKTICGLAGITKKVSAKTARHTFATLYYKKNQGDIATLSNILGHSSLAMTMIYAHIDKENRSQGIHVFDDLA